MAYVHGINDLRNQDQQEDNQGGSSRENELFDGDRGDPRKNSNFRTLIIILCPYLSCLSFLVIISFVEIAFYLATIIHSLIVSHELSPDLTSFLGPCTSTLATFGAKVIFLNICSTLGICN